MHDEHPAAPYDRPVAQLGTRARLAVAALAATALVHVWDLGARQWSIGVLEEFAKAEQPAPLGPLELADMLVNLGYFASYGLLVITAILFLRWIHGLVKLTRALGAQDLKWRPSQAVWGFIIPFISLVRPYQVLRDVQQRLDPEEIEPPAPRLDRDVETDYRSVAFVVPPPAKRLSASFLGLWWASFIGMNLIGHVTQRFAGAEEVDAVITMYHVAMLQSIVAIAAARPCMG